MILTEPLEITQRVAREFVKLDIPYFIGGSMASSLHGIPRSTQDVDLVAEITDKHIIPLVQSLSSEFYIDAEMMRQAIEKKSSFNIIHLKAMLKIDIFILKPDALSQEEMARRRQYQIAESTEQNLFIASAEDIIIHKLYWYQLGGRVSERQWNDILGVIQVQKERLDHQYLERAAQQRRVEDILKKALDIARREADQDTQD